MNAYHKYLGSVLIFWAIIITTFPTAADEDFTCDAIEVLEKAHFTHVRCANTLRIGSRDIRYIAMPHTDLQKLKRFQDLAAQAVACGGMDFTARIADPATVINGCDPLNCREARYFGIRRQ